MLVTISEPLLNGIRMDSGTVNIFAYLCINSLQGDFNYKHVLRQLL